MYSRSGANLMVFRAVEGPTEGGRGATTGAHMAWDLVYSDTRLFLRCFGCTVRIMGATTTVQR